MFAVLICGRVDCWWDTCCGGTCSYVGSDCCILVRIVRAEVHICQSQVSLPVRLQMETLQQCSSWSVFSWAPSSIDANISSDLETTLSRFTLSTNGRNGWSHEENISPCTRLEMGCRDIGRYSSMHREDLGPRLTWDREPIRLFGMPLHQLYAWHRFSCPALTSGLGISHNQTPFCSPRWTFLRWDALVAGQYDKIPTDNVPEVRPKHYPF